MRLVTTHIRVGLKTAYALALRLWLTCRIDENSAGYFCQGGTLIASFRCRCGNLVGLGMDLQPERINRSRSKFSTCNHILPDYLSQVLLGIGIPAQYAHTRSFKSVHLLPAGKRRVTSSARNATWGLIQ